MRRLEARFVSSLTTMHQTRRILLIADAELRRSADYEAAAWLAQKTGAALHIVAFDFNQLIASMQRVDASAMALARDAYLRQHREWLAQEASVLRSRGIDVTYEVNWEPHPRDEILMHVKESGADLVIKAAHADPLVRRLLFSPLDWQLMHRTPVPLILVNGSVHPVPRRVIVAVDTGLALPDVQAHNDTIIRTALALALQCDIELHLATAFDAAPQLALTASSTLPMVDGALYQQLYDASEAAFTALADAHGVPAERRHFLLGNPALTIAGLAIERANDIIVVGASQGTRVERLFVGSTAERILSYAPCNVMVVPQRNA